MQCNATSDSRPAVAAHRFFSHIANIHISFHMITAITCIVTHIAIPLLAILFRET